MSKPTVRWQHNSRLGINFSGAYIAADFWMVGTKSLKCRIPMLVDVLKRKGEYWLLTELVEARIATVDEQGEFACDSR